VASFLQLARRITRMSCLYLPHFIDVRRAAVAARREQVEEKDVRKILSGAVLMLATCHSEEDNDQSKYPVSQQ